MSGWQTDKHTITGRTTQVKYGSKQTNVSEFLKNLYSKEQLQDPLYDTP